MVWTGANGRNGCNNGAVLSTVTIEVCENNCKFLTLPTQSSYQPGLTGVPKSEAHRAALTGRQLSEAHKLAISQALTGQHHPSKLGNQNARKYESTPDASDITELGEQSEGEAAGQGSTGADYNRQGQQEEEVREANWTGQQLRSCWLQHTQGYMEVLRSGQSCQVSYAEDDATRIKAESHLHEALGRMLKTSRSHLLVQPPHFSTSPPGPRGTAGAQRHNRSTQGAQALHRQPGFRCCCPTPGAWGARAWQLTPPGTPRGGQARRART
jgi:hypothetical protein